MSQCAAGPGILLLTLSYHFATAGASQKNETSAPTVQGEAVGAETPNIDECLSSPCGQHGTCSTAGMPRGEHKCSCKRGYKGVNCDEEIDMCIEYPGICQNSGTCVSYNQPPGDYICHCLIDYKTDVNCSRRINDCAKYRRLNGIEACQHNGTCYDKRDPRLGGYNCNCVLPYWGANCKLRFRLCKDEKNKDKGVCHNNGNCSEYGGSYKCSCPKGYNGTNCANDIDECASSPCLNDGWCRDKVARYECQCQRGFTGTHCETNIDECKSNPCEHEGTCVNGRNRYDCICPKEWVGKFCEADALDCHADTCKHGDCTESGLQGTGDYRCICNRGWKGKNCSEDVDECAEKPCQNGGTCTQMDPPFYDCRCPKGLWTGRRCHKRVFDKCHPNPCKNFGKCEKTAEASGFFCKCTEGWDGTNCTECAEVATGKNYAGPLNESIYDLVLQKPNRNTSYVQLWNFVYDNEDSFSIRLCIDTSYVIHHSRNGKATSKLDIVQSVENKLLGQWFHYDNTTKNIVTVPKSKIVCNGNLDGSVFIGFANSSSCYMNGSQWEFQKSPINNVPVAYCKKRTNHICPGEKVTVPVASAYDNGSHDPDGDHLSLLTTPDRGTTLNSSITDILLIVADGYGKTSTCQTTHEVDEAKQLPKAYCKNVSLDLAADGFGSITAYNISDGSSVSCGTASIDISMSEFNCSSIGYNNVILTVTDDNNGSASCSSVVTVNDVTAPQAECRTDIRVELDKSGLGYIYSSQINNRSSDACRIDNSDVSPSWFNCSSLGKHNVTLTVNDTSGQISNCTTVVTVEAAKVRCKNYPLVLDGNGIGSITCENINNQSIYPCGDPDELVPSRNQFNCSDLGENNVTLTFTDIMGQNYTCRSVVTVKAANVRCKNYPLVLDGNGIGSITHENINNHSIYACGDLDVAELSPNKFNCSNLGENNVTLSFTDNIGQEYTCTSVVTVKGNIYLRQTKMQSVDT